MVDITYIGDESEYDDDVEGIQIHTSVVDNDLDYAGWEPVVDNTPEVDPDNDIFGYYD